MVSIRPSPKGEGNQGFINQLEASLLFQSALHPMVKGIICSLISTPTSCWFQSALHPKVRGITLLVQSYRPDNWFQSALHPKVKGILVSLAGLTKMVSVSIRPSPKGEGNRRTGHRSRFGTPCFNPPFTQR